MSGQTVVASLEEVTSVIETGFQGPPGPVAVDLPITGVQYDAQSRVIAYVRGTVAYTITYPDANTIVLTGGGVTKTVTLDGSGRIVSVI